jgi:hypothetical protein
VTPLVCLESGQFYMAPGLLQAYRWVGPAQQFRKP